MYRQSAKLNMRKGWECSWKDFLWLLAQRHEFDLACQRWQQRGQV